MLALPVHPATMPNRKMRSDVTLSIEPAADRFRMGLPRLSARFFSGVS